MFGRKDCGHCCSLDCPRRMMAGGGIHRSESRSVPFARARLQIQRDYSLLISGTQVDFGDLEGPGPEQKLATRVGYCSVQQTATTAVAEGRKKTLLLRHPEPLSWPPSSCALEAAATSDSSPTAPRHYLSLSIQHPCSPAYPQPLFGFLPSDAASGQNRSRSAVPLRPVPLRSLLT